MSAGVACTLLEAVALDQRCSRLDADMARMRAHLDDGRPEVRKHARDWLTQLRAERTVLCRWQSEVRGALPVLPIVCSARPCHQQLEQAA